MKTSLFKAVAAFGLTVLVLDSYAGQGSADKGMGTDNMKNCKAMDNMRDKNKGCMGSVATQPLAMSDGEVEAIDKVNKRITLKHGPIKSKTVDMGPMVMSFRVQKTSLLSNVKVGDKVKFTVENVKDKTTVTALQVQE
jgi:Cu/Ag efflux protein CusF